MVRIGTIFSLMARPFISRVSGRAFGFAFAASLLSGLALGMAILSSDLDSVHYYSLLLLSTCHDSLSLLYTKKFISSIRIVYEGFRDGIMLLFTILNAAVLLF